MADTFHEENQALRYRFAQIISLLGIDDKKTAQGKVVALNRYIKEVCGSCPYNGVGCFEKCHLIAVRKILKGE